MRRTFLTFMAIFLSLALCAKPFCLQRGKDINVMLPDSVETVFFTALQMFCGDVDCVLDARVVPVKVEKNADMVCNVDRSLPREGFRLSVCKGKLTISGADAHGLAYGLLQVSRMLGVSPWVYWADSTPKKIDEYVLPDGYIDMQSPRVAYRGIFINDEDWGLNPWASRQEPEAWTVRQGRIKGAIGPKVNEKIFQLLLRLRANYYWPAMHECSQPFFTIDGNREMAARYGIYLGGSHCEPMACSVAAEWQLRGNGEYDYVNNRDNVLRFFSERVEEVKDQNVVFTIGMRGVHDSGMLGVKTRADRLKYLQMVIADQRRILSEKINDDVTQVPQVFIPYKEVLDVYKDGLDVPDDVTLMWTDDNYGYVRHFPDSVERGRKGGNGMYYHASYWGRPHDYIWLGTLSPNLLYQQMSEAYRRGVQAIWVLNVGDIKPVEYHLEEFLTLAWNGEPPSMESFYAREFGTSLAPAIAMVMDEHFALAEQRKPEHMAGTRTEEKAKAYWSVVRAIDNWTKGDVADRIRRYQAISDKVEQLWQMVEASKRDEFFELVKYPVQASAQINFKFLCPDRCIEAYDSIRSLSYIYNKVCANGKWDGIMDMEPRSLPVFGKVEPQMLPEYPDGPKTDDLTIRDMQFQCDADSVVLEVRLLPTHPVNGRLRFSVAVDGGKPEERDYQTYDRSEEWKQNVLHGYASRKVKLPLDKSRTVHKVNFSALDEGVFLQKILLRKE